MRLLRSFSLLIVVCLLINLLGFPYEVVRSQSPTSWTSWLPKVIKKSPLPPTLFGADVTPVRTQSGIIQMRDINMHWTKAGDVLWSDVEAIEGKYNWSSLSALEDSLLLIQAMDMQPIINVRSTPPWAQDVPGYYCGRIKLVKMAAFGKFMEALVSRYSQPPYNVKYWEIWNEPDIAPIAGAENSGLGCWGNINDKYFGGGAYAEMLKAIYARIKAADPSAKVIAGALLLDCDPNPPVNGICQESSKKSISFLEGILRHNGQNDGAKYFDLISFHAYDYAFYDLNRDPSNPWNESLGIYGSPNWSTNWDKEHTALGAKADFISKQFQTRGIPLKPMLATELAILCGSNSAPPGTAPCYSDPASAFEQTKAYYLTRAYLDAFYYDLQGALWYRALGWRNSNLLNGDLTPRPVYYALQTARMSLSNSTVLGTIQSFPGVFGYKFDRGDRLVWVIWSLDGLNHQVNLGSVPLSAYDTFGVPIELNSILTIDMKPIYLEWPR